MQKIEKRAILPTTNGWIRCPICRKKILRVLPTTSGHDVVAPCYKCGIDWITPVKQKPVPKRPDSKD